MARMYQADRAELATIFQRVKAPGVTTSLDLSMPDPNSATGRANWQAIFAATLPYVDVFLPSAGELLLMLRRTLFDKIVAEAGGAELVEYISPAIISELAQELLKMGTKIVGLKVGHRGLYLRTANPTTLAKMGRARPADLTAWADREM